MIVFLTILKVVGILATITLIILALHLRKRDDVTDREFRILIYSIGLICICTLVYRMF